MHEMKLKDWAFDSIKNGFKTIEMRLNDEKRKLVKIGDIIEFTNIETNEKLKVCVINLHYFNTFEELYKSFDKVKLGYKESDIASPSDMDIFYSKGEQEKYGVLGIEIKLK